MRTEIDLIPAKIRDFLSSGAGVVEEEEDCGVSLRSTSRSRALECPAHLLPGEVAGLGRRNAFDRDGSHTLGFPQQLRGTSGEVLKEGDQDGTPVVPSRDVVRSIDLEKAEKIPDLVG